MARLYLLDTNILSHLVRQPQGRVAERIAAVGEANVLTSVIVACELRYGAAQAGLAKAVAPDRGHPRCADDQAARVRRRTRLRVDPCDTRTKGTPIGAHDMLIAAHARAIDAVCVTDNVAEFKRVPGLRLENWLR